MERLKAALEKARAAREETLSSERGTGHAGPLRGDRQGRPALAELWRALAPLEIDTEKLARRRIAFGHRAEATAFDVLRTKVLQLTAANGWRRVAVTSPLPGSGKTTTAINLAIALARQIDLRILLVDLDMRRPSVAKTLGQSGKRRLPDVLEGRAAFADHARRHGENLALALNDRTLRDPSDLLLRAKTAEVLDGIERLYQPDLTIFDLPPMLVNDDAAAFLGRVDCALLVAEAGATTIAQVDVCEKELAEQTNVLGVVLNKCRFHSDGYAHYDKYD